MDAPRSARPGEFRELMEFIDLNFRPGQSGRSILQRQYPHLFQNKPAFLARNILLRDQGKIVGSLAVHPIPIRLEEVVLQAGGIGQVGAHPQRRGEGIMTTLLNEAIRRMQQRGYPISILGGDRRRYGWFGWERGGVRNIFSLTSRVVGRPTPAEGRLALKPLRMTPAVCRKILAIDRTRLYGVERVAGQMPPLFERRSREVWGCQTGRCFAYLVLGGPHHQARPYERIDEAGGDPELAMSMVRVLMARHRRERLWAITGPNQEDVGLFRPFSSGWERTTDVMIKIVDLPLLLEELKPLLSRRARVQGIGGTFRFVMEDSGQEGSLELGKGPAGKVRLNDQDMVTLFFGMLPVREVFAGGRTFSRLDRILPIPLFVPPLNHV